MYRDDSYPYYFLPFFGDSGGRVEATQEPRAAAAANTETTGRIGGGNVTADERRQKAIYKFFDTYREYKQLDNVRCHTCTEISGETLIEIHRYYGERKGELILRVTQEGDEGAEVSAEVTAYEQAAGQLEALIEIRRKNQETRRRA